MPSRYRVWIAADDTELRASLDAACAGPLFRVRTLAHAAEAAMGSTRDLPDALIVQAASTNGPGRSLVREIHARWPRLPIIAVTPSDLDSAVAAFADGAFDCLAIPFDAAEVLRIITRACEQARRLAEQAATPALTPGAEVGPEIIGRSPRMREIFRAISRLARLDLPVIIAGEAGTGKELIARALHRHSPRASHAFTVARLSGLTPAEIEHGLFGDSAANRNGATTPGGGLVADAENGTLFLDPITELPPGAQARLIRLAAAGMASAGRGMTTPVSNIRLIGAITEHGRMAARAPELRDALAESLGAITITLPPLRDRREDIPLLLEHHLAEAAREFAVSPKQFTPDALGALCELDWPGNVAQLATVCRWVTAMSPLCEVGLDDLPEDLRPMPPAPQATPPENGSWEDSLTHWVDDRLRRGDVGLARLAFDSVENVLISAALRYTRGHRQDAARLLGVGRNTLTRKIKKTAPGARRP